MPAETDPFTQVYMALWGLLLDNADFCAMVKPQHRMSYVSLPGMAINRYPEQDVRPADGYPMVAIKSVGGPTNLGATSDATVLTRQYQIIVQSNDRRLKYTDGTVTRGENPLQWAILRAMAPWETALSALTWGGQSFAKSFYLGLQEGQIQPRLKQGWVMAWMGNVDFWFTNSSLPVTEG